MEKKLDKNGYPLMDSEALCQEALDLWGIDSQVWMAIEEMAELTNALCKMKRGRNNPEDIVTEIADVQIMMEQLQLFFGKEEVDTERNRKLIRLHDRMCDYRVSWAKAEDANENENPGAEQGGEEPPMSME